MWLVFCNQYFKCISLLESGPKRSVIKQDAELSSKTPQDVRQTEANMRWCKILREEQAGDQNKDPIGLTRCSRKKESQYCNKIVALLRIFAKALLPTNAGGNAHGR